MDGSFYGDLQSLEEYFSASQKPAISVAVVSTASTGDRPNSGIYQDEESVDLSALLEAYNDAPTAPSVATTNQRSYPEATPHISGSELRFSFRNFCVPAPTTNINMYGSESCLGMTGSTELPPNPLPSDPTPSQLPPLDTLGGTQPAPGKAPRPSKSSKKKNVDKNSAEYRTKRDRNNIAVRKSRQKSKHHVIETERRVHELEEENARLQSKINLLAKELNVLKSLFTSAGVAHPPSLRIKEELALTK